MPVTARLSRRFYEAIGDDAANDLVNWMNDVDATYRTDLLRLNEANLDRFSAEIERQAAVLRNEMQAGLGAFRGVMQAEFAALRGEMHAGFAAVRGEMQSGFAAVDTRFAKFEARMLRWMLVFWTGTMAGAAATIFAVLRSR